MERSGTSRLERIRAAIEAHQGRLIGYAARITGDLESARDVVQDTFLRLCQQDLDEIADHLPAWLFRVCRNRALDVRKKEGPLQPFDDTQPPPADTPARNLEQQVEVGESARRILALVA